MSKHEWEHRWERLEPIGGGAQGHSFLARLKGTDTPATHVLKQLKRQQDVIARGRMFMEVAALEVLTHPGLVQVVDSNASSWRDTQVPLYVVFDRVVGYNVGEYLSQGNQPSFDELCQFTHEILRVLEYCHTHGVIHRDIKPENVMLRNNSWSHPVLIDFGLSFNASVDDLKATDINEPLGNRFVRLPELEADSEQKRIHITDVSQCVALFYLLFTGTAPRSLLDNHGHAPHERDRFLAALNETPEQLRNRIVRFVRGGLTPPIQSRWQTASAAAEYLRELIDTAKGTTPTWNLATALDELALQPNQADHKKFLERSRHVLAHMQSTCVNAVGLMHSRLKDVYSFSSSNDTNDAQACAFRYSFSASRLAPSSKRHETEIRGRRHGDTFVIVSGSLGEVLRMNFYDDLLLESMREPIERSLYEFMNLVCQADRTTS